MMTMLAGRLDTRKLEFGVVEVPIPEPGPGQVRIKVEAAGVCLSDVHLIDGMLKPETREGVIITPEGAPSPSAMKWPARSTPSAPGRADGKKVSGCYWTALSATTAACSPEG
jgi:Alcohol dehydrogenase GroES-like domain